MPPGVRSGTVVQGGDGVVGDSNTIVEGLVFNPLQMALWMLILLLIVNTFSSIKFVE